MPLPSTKTGCKQWIIVLIVFAPVLFINVTSSHDWGDDFAQYILQAKCIVEGKAQLNYTIDDPEYYSILGPTTRPVGLPLLLAPFYYFFGNNIFAFSCLMSACYFMMALSVFRFLRENIEFIPAIVWTCTLIYSPAILQLKLSILSDFPFIILLLIFFMITRKPPSRSQIILLGIIAALMISFRLIGVIIFSAYLAYWFLHKSINKSYKAFIEQPVLFILISLLLFILINSLSITNLTTTWNSYSSAIELISIERFLNTVNHYAYVYTIVYEQEIWAFTNIIFKSVMIVLVCIGLLFAIRRNKRFDDWFVIIYLVAIFLYPYSSEATRFLLPVFPVLLLYQAEGLKNIHLPSYKLNKWKIYILPILVLVSYKINLENIIRHQGTVQEGPQEKLVQQAFDYIKSSLPVNQTYAFSKHHAFALYTDRKCIPARDNLSVKELKSLLNKHPVDYLVHIEPVSGKNILQLVQSEPLSYKLIWQNSRCKIFQHL